jgi:hypothetical protein
MRGVLCDRIDDQIHREDGAAGKILQLSKRLTPKILTATDSLPLIARTCFGDGARLPACCAMVLTVTSSARSSDRSLNDTAPPDFATAYALAVLDVMPVHASSSLGLTPVLRHIGAT